MLWILIALIVLALLALVAYRIRSQEGLSDTALPYSKAPSLFTPAERSFFGVLTQAVGNDFQIFGKVRVADVLTVKEGLERSARNTAFNRISAKHFDFLLCSPSDLSVLCAIELNDKSHGQRKRQERDDFLDAACKAACLPLVVFPAQAAYTPADVAAKIAQALSTNSSAPIVQKAVGSELQERVPATPPTLKVEPQESAAPTCPKCSAPMVKRTAKAGDDAGREFWGCSKFPSCRGMLAA